MLHTQTGHLTNKMLEYLIFIKYQGPKLHTPGSQIQ